MEDARPTPQQPLLHMLVVFSYVVHSNKTHDLQWGLVEHRCNSGCLYKQKRTHAKSWILSSFAFSFNIIFAHKFCGANGLITGWIDTSLAFGVCLRWSEWCSKMYCN